MFKSEDNVVYEKQQVLHAQQQEKARFDTCVGQLNQVPKPIEGLQQRVEELEIARLSLGLLYHWLSQNLVDDRVKDYIISRVLMHRY